MAERLPDPEDPELDDVVLGWAAEAAEQGKVASVPELVHELRPTKTEIGFRKPEVLWSLYRLWQNDQIVLYMQTAAEDDKEQKGMMKIKGGQKDDPQIGYFSLPNVRTRLEPMAPERPPRPDLPLKKWPRTCEQYIREENAPFTVAYGGGVDSTAMLIGFKRMGLRPDLILFADVGNELPETYDFMRRVMKPWLISVGFPKLEEVKYTMTAAGVAARASKGLETKAYTTLEENCLFNHTLPSLAFGFRSHACSTKWKVKPQLDYIEKGPFKPYVEAARDAGVPIIRAIGFDDSEGDKGRRNRIKDNTRYMHWYPLQEWHWDRERCKEEIRREGMEVPVKSACFFCPSTKPHEIEHLVRNHPDMADRIIAMEDGFQPYAKKGPHQGLWFVGGEITDQERTRLPILGQAGEYFFPSGRPTTAELDRFIEYYYLGGWKVSDDAPWRGTRPKAPKLPGRMSDFIAAYKRLCLLHPNHPNCHGWRPK